MAQPSIQIDVDTEPKPDRIEQLRNHLRAFNETFIGPYEAHHLLVTAQAPGSQVMIGGIHGWGQFGWLYINLVWVDQPWQRQGIGSRLLSGIESTAKSMGINRARLATSDFQSGIHLYKKQGYETFASIPFSSLRGEDEHTEYLMWKKGL